MLSSKFFRFNKVRFNEKLYNHEFDIRCSKTSRSHIIQFEFISFLSASRSFSIIQTKSRFITCAHANQCIDIIVVGDILISPHKRTINTGKLLYRRRSILCPWRCWFRIVVLVKISPVHAIYPKYPNMTELITWITIVVHVTNTRNRNVVQFIGDRYSRKRHRV